MGVVHAHDHNWTSAQASFERALTLDHTLTPVYTAYSLWVLRPLGRNQEAERLLLGALANDPLSLDLEREIAELYFCVGRYQEAIERLERVRAIDPDSRSSKSSSAAPWRSPDERRRASRCSIPRVWPAVREGSKSQPR